MGEEFEFKGTPGKWYVAHMPHDHGGGDFWVKSDHNKVVHYGTDIMAEDFGEHNGYPREQRMADAKLISSAPELLEALMIITNALKVSTKIDRKYWTKRAEKVIKKAL